MSGNRGFFGVSSKDRQGVLKEPNILFSGSTVELQTINAVIGMIAFDTTLAKQVMYDGTDWVETGDGNISDLPLTTVGDLLVIKDSISTVTNPNPTTLVSMSAGSEVVLPGTDLTLTGLLSGPATIAWNLWISQVWGGHLKSGTLRLRRDSLSGSILATFNFGDAGDSSGGHSINWNSSFIDNNPTNYQYVMTAYFNGGVGYSDTRTMSVSALDITDPFDRVPIGTANQVLKTIDGLPVWNNLFSSNSEIINLTEKALAKENDLLIIEDSESSYSKKKLNIKNLPYGSLVNPMSTIGDIIYADTSVITITNPSPSGVLTIVSGTSETIITGMDLNVITGFPTGPATIAWNLWISQVWVSKPKSGTLRLRRDSLSGSILASIGFGDTGDNTNGHRTNWNSSYIDSSPTDYRYVVTIQINGGVGYSDTRTMSVSCENGLENALALSIGSEKEILKVVSGIPSWESLLPVYTNDVSNPPTDSELDTAIGTPATVGSGFAALLNDNGAGTNTYLICSDGANWWYQELTKAV